MIQADPLLAIDDLEIAFRGHGWEASAVAGISLSVSKGETVGLVGESGCGKTVTALSILRLIPDPPGRVVKGSIVFGEDGDLLKLPERAMRNVRGNKISMVFQEPMTSLNPVLTCGYQVDEAVVLHQRVGRREARERTIEMLQKVGLPAPEQRAREYPHQLSGGMRQRVMIAMALSCHPSLLIADEPTTALDVTIQAQILDLLRRLQSDFEMAILLITHDLGVIAETANRVAVMYAGRIVEQAAVSLMFRDPLHPYTRGLLASVPRLGSEKRRLSPIPGFVPDPARFPPGCHFNPRCTLADDRCRQDEPSLLEVQSGHFAACWKAGT